MSAEKVEISHPDKELYPHAGFTKQDVADYMERIAPFMLPDIAGRPLTFKQYPKGIEEKGFYHKHAPGYFPDFIERLKMKMSSRNNKQMEMVTAEEPRDLVYFAGQNVVEIHMALSVAKSPRKPDQVIFDFDPSDGDFEKVRAGALTLHDMLEKAGLPSFVKTTGSRGVHVHIPLKPEKDYKQVKAMTRKLSEKLHQKEPDITTMEQRKNKRGDKVFLDYLRNDYGMTGIAPYSLRARPGAPVATPIDWDELKDQKLGPQSYRMDNIFRRLSRKKDPWGAFFKSQVSAKELESFVNS